MSSPRTLQANVYASERKVEQGDIREVEVLEGVAFTVWSWGFELILLVMAWPQQTNDFVNLMHNFKSLDNWILLGACELTANVLSIYSTRWMYLASEMLPSEFIFISML